MTIFNSNIARLESSINESDKLNWCVYIVECQDKTLYTGVTNDLESRIEQHNHGKTGAKYTRARRPVKLVYSEAQKNKSEAMKREHVIKKMTRSEKLLLIK